MTNAQTITNATADQSPAQALWRIAVSNYEAEVAAYAVVEAEYEAAMRKYDELRDAYAERLAEFERFKPIQVHYTEDGIRAVYAKLFKERPIADADAPDPTDAERAALYAKAAQIVADHAQLQDELQEALDPIWDDTEKLHDGACDKLSEAREKLFDTPAPDAPALLYKLDILLAYLNECESEDKERVASVIADARRLFGGQ